MKVVIRSHRAFTLVELIVVITILAILGAIAFFALGGYSQDGKNAAVVSNLHMVADAVSTASANEGVSFRKYVEHSGSYMLTGGTFTVRNYALTGGTFSTVGTNYSAGTVNQNALAASLNLTAGIDRDDRGNRFMIAAVDYLDSSYNPPKGMNEFQIAGTIRKNGIDTAVVLGNYVPNTASGDVLGLIPAAGSGSLPVQDGSTLTIPYTYVAGECTNALRPLSNCVITAPGGGEEGGGQIIDPI